MSNVSDELPIHHYRTIFISDIHLGTRGCKADRLIDFLGRHRCDELYLVGDVIDGWQLRSALYWPPSHNTVVRMVLERAERGTKVVYVTGNHDDLLRPYTDFRFGDVDVVDQADYVGADGRRLVVIHGDQFDVVANHQRWLAVLGDFGYRALLRMNGAVNWVRRCFGRGEWSLSAWAKNSVKRVVNSLGGYEKTIARFCREGGYQGIVCGHIHRAAVREFADVRYINCGDWVESCTAIVEDDDGSHRILDWSRPTLVAAPPRERNQAVS